MVWRDFRLQVREDMEISALKDIQPGCMDPTLDPKPYDVGQGCFR